MNLELKITNDGSHTVINKELNVSFHSTHGAIQESQHVYINTGLNSIREKKISILEIGFGTGLNALLTLINANANCSEIIYDTVEPHPVDDVLISSLNYLSVLNAEHLRDQFLAMHLCPWNVQTRISENFHFTKILGDIREVHIPSTYHLVYFDVFDPLSQPELWTENVFKKIYMLMNDGGTLVTYSSKVVVRRAMEAAGFEVEKVAGPHGKREIVKAVKRLNGSLI